MIRKKLLPHLLFALLASICFGQTSGVIDTVGSSNVITDKNISVNAGRIGGKNITHSAYQLALKIQLNRMRDQGVIINNRTVQNAGDFAWNAIIERELKDQKIKELGLEVYQDEMYNFLLLTPPRAFQTDLTNAGFFLDDEGKFDTKSYQEAVQNRTIPVELSPLLANWDNYLRTWLADRKLQTIYNNLGSVSDDQVKRDFIKKNMNCTVDYLYLTLSGIPDSLIEVSNEEISKRYNADKEDAFSLNERRTMEYVVFQVPKPVMADDSLNVAAVEDTVMQLALDFSADAEDYSFSEAIIRHEINKTDTIDVHETFGVNSGIPFQMGVLRDAVRFAFDNSIGSISDPITAKNGIAVFHSLSEKGSDYKPLDDVRESIRRTLIRENKKKYAKSILQKVQNKEDTWKELADSDFLLQYKTGETQKIGGSFPGIGYSNQLTGTLLAMEAGEISGVIDTYNAVLRLKMTARDTFSDSLYEAEYTAIRNQLLNIERSREYSRWLTEAKNNIKIEDYRSEVY